MLLFFFNSNIHWNVSFLARINHVMYTMLDIIILHILHINLILFPSPSYIFNSSLLTPHSLPLFSLSLCSKVSIFKKKGGGGMRERMKLVPDLRPHICTHSWPHHMKEWSIHTPSHFFTPILCITANPLENPVLHWSGSCKWHQWHPGSIYLVLAFPDFSI